MGNAANGQTVDGVGAKSLEEINALTELVIGAAIEVHKTLGPGLLESAYSACLVHELQLRGLSVQVNVALPIDYKGLKVDSAYRIDLVVENTLVVELKASDGHHAIHEAQLLTYMRLAGKRIGLLINFNVRILIEGVKRRVL